MIELMNHIFKKQKKEKKTYLALKKNIIVKFTFLKYLDKIFYLVHQHR
jgi:hypothetical protein